ncbi:MAG: 2-hydroxyacid dehydrogenase [Flavobacteriales bacterium]|nr:2-hydroxyacid dehydrogenase [Flavobacteriales bacterium]MCW8914112.1 2-hydroxyacid dehydrogenase [Flavobacteriales bacterium]MCW8938170.1 2-hydroxyacid dehydrogenase [Flavobacteriales bacterium]MCW8940531.1 2-hydroxyacid dehydrogenase [Flavobacteriales bacterium]MCW8968336.1 2-hydroxyacid dehydrogenase [Flavobacteriales bacterium]
MKVLAYSTHGFDQPFLEEAAKNKHEFSFTEKPLNENTVEMANGFDAVALFSSDNANAKVIEKLAEYKVNYITLRSVGYDHVDLQKAHELGIKVANVPEYSPYAIAEHGVALLLALNRKLHKAESLIQLQDFRLDTLVGFDLNNKTIGIIGTGKIGFAFAKIMNGFGCKLLAYDPVENPSAEEINMEYTTLEILLKNSDVVSLNCPLNEKTHYLLGKKEFASMKKGSILINTARGAVINTNALIESIENEHLGGACLDVYEKEKGLFFNNHTNSVLKDPVYSRLRSFPNVIITGHQAFLTREALIGIAETTIYNLSSWENNGTCENDL